MAYKDITRKKRITYHTSGDVEMKHVYPYQVNIYDPIYNTMFVSNRHLINRQLSPIDKVNSFQSGVEPECNIEGKNSIQLLHELVDSQFLKSIQWILLPIPQQSNIHRKRDVFETVKLNI